MQVSLGTLADKQFPEIFGSDVLGCFVSSGELDSFGFAACQAVAARK